MDSSELMAGLESETLARRPQDFASAACICAPIGRPRRAA